MWATFYNTVVLWVQKGLLDIWMEFNFTKFPLALYRYALIYSIAFIYIFIFLHVDSFIFLFFILFNISNMIAKLYSSIQILINFSNFV